MLPELNTLDRSPTDIEIDRQVALAREAEAYGSWITYLIRDPRRPDLRGNVAGWPIYVGQTDEFGKRVRNHLRKSEKLARKGKGIKSRLKALLHAGVIRTSKCLTDSQRASPPCSQRRISHDSADRGATILLTRLRCRTWLVRLSRSTICQPNGFGVSPSHRRGRTASHSNLLVKFVAKSSDSRPQPSSTWKTLRASCATFATERNFSRTNARFAAALGAEQCGFEGQNNQLTQIRGFPRLCGSVERRCSRTSLPLEISLRLAAATKMPMMPLAERVGGLCSGLYRSL